MKLNKDGTITYEITSADCDDAIAFEKMMGHDREAAKKVVDELKDLSKMSIYVIDKDGNYVLLKK